MNSRRASLFLIEQLLALVFFALAAAVCMQLFVSARQLSDADLARDQALAPAQDAAEVYKACGGDLAAAAAALAQAEADANGLTQYFDAAWRPCAADLAAYELRIEAAHADSPGLAQAWLSVAACGGSVLIAFPLTARTAR